MYKVLGVDAGASKTHALVIDGAGNVLGFGDAGCGNHQSYGLAPAIAEIRLAVEKALAGANLTQARLSAGAFCLAGADLEEDYLMLHKALQELQIVDTLQVRNDTIAALRAGLTRNWGVVVICGTGFNAAAVGQNGKEIVLPGLGGISGDWGGGGSLSYEMIRMVMRAWDGRGSPTLLTEIVLRELGVQSEYELLNKLYTKKIDYRQLLNLVPFLFDAAEQGDVVSRDLIVMLGTEVAVTANALLRRLGTGRLDNVEVILGGSVFKGKGSLLLDTVRESIFVEFPNAEIKELSYEPVIGAALLGLESLGIAVDTKIFDALETTLPDQFRIRKI